MIRAHHQHAIDQIRQIFADDPQFLALLLGGSVAKGNATDASDVDFILVATDDEYARRVATQDLWYLNTAVCNYPGGYAEAKIVDRAFLQAAAHHGSEPIRSAFAHVHILFSHDPALPDLIARIPRYPDEERAEKMLAFFSQAWVLSGFFAKEAERRQDPYLLAQTAADLVFYTCRFLLAYNRILFSSQKRLIETVRQVATKPEALDVLIEQALAQPGMASARALFASVHDLQPWGYSYKQVLVRFVQDREWRWQAGRPDLADW